MVQKRDLCGFLQSFRRLLLGRPYKRPNLRFAMDLSPRTPECPPNLPKGINHKLSDNFYYKRDSRSEVGAPLVIERNEIFPCPEESCTPRASKPNPKMHDWDGHHYV